MPKVVFHLLDGCILSPKLDSFRKSSTGGCVSKGDCGCGVLSERRSDTLLSHPHAVLRNPHPRSDHFQFPLSARFGSLRIAQPTRTMTLCKPQDLSLVLSGPQGPSRILIQGRKQSHGSKPYRSQFFLCLLKTRSTPGFDSGQRGRFAEDEPSP